jgi:hypothetical protein
MARKKNYTKIAMKAYEKAFKNLQTAQRKSFKFLKSTVKAFETRLGRIKQGIATKADVNYLKQFSTESKAISKARSYVSDEGRKMSVAQGKLIERRKVQALRKQAINNVDEIKDLLNSYPDTTVSVRGDILDLTEKDAVIDMLDAFVDLRRRDMNEDEYSYLLGEAKDLMYASNQYQVNDIFRYMESRLRSMIDNDMRIEVADSEISTIGTPYEGWDE